MSLMWQAVWNSVQIEQVAVEEYKDLLIADVKQAGDEVDADRIILFAL